MAFPFALLQQQPDAVQVGCQYRQRDRAREAVGAMTADSVKAPMLQAVDRRLDCRMRLSRRREALVFLPLAVGPRKSPLLGQRVEVEQCVEPQPVGRTVKAPVKAAGSQLRIQRLRLLHQWHRHVDILAPPQNLVMKDELMLVLDQRHSLGGQFKTGQYDQLDILQSIFRLAARRRRAGIGKAFTAPLTERWIGRNRCPDARLWALHGREALLARGLPVVRGRCRLTAVGDDAYEGLPAAVGRGRRRKSTGPALRDQQEAAPGGLGWARHDESRKAGRPQASAKWSTACMFPSWHRGHRRNERPVNAS